MAVTINTLPSVTWGTPAAVSACANGPVALSYPVTRTAPTAQQTTTVTANNGVTCDTTSWSSGKEHVALPKISS